MRVCPSVRPSIHPSVHFFSIGQKWVETNKNKTTDDEAVRDFTSHDLFCVYELVIRDAQIGFALIVVIGTAQFDKQFD